MNIDVVFDYQIFFHQEYGGISRYVVELARHLGHLPNTSSSIYAGCHHNAYVEGVDDVSVIGQRREKKSGILGMTGLLRNAAGFFVHVARTPVTHIHQTYFYEALRPPRKAARILTVYDMTHELFPELFASPGRTSAAKRRAVKNADHIICISESTRRDLIEIFDVPEEKVTAIHLGFSPLFSDRAFQTVPKKLYTRPYVLVVGHRGGYKNFEMLLKAFATTSTLKEGADVLCFGGGRLTKAELELIKSLGLRSDQFHCVSGGDDVLASAYSHAEFLVYPSLYEGFGFPPLEAMALGCPVACSNVSSMPEVVGSAAVTFDPTSPEDMAESFDLLAENSSLRNECRTAGLARSQMFTWERCAEKTREVYANTL